MRVRYVNLTSTIPPRDAIYLKALERQGHTITVITDTTPGWRKLWRIARDYRADRTPHDIIWVGYTGYLLVPLLRLISAKPIFFNAYSSLYEGMIVSRKVARPLSITAFKYYLIDWLSFHSATSISVETNNQRDYLRQLFRLSPHKMIRLWTGADDMHFYRDLHVAPLTDFTVVFRGGFLPESGILCALEAAHILKDRPDIKFRFIGFGQLQDEVDRRLTAYQLTNVEWLRDRYPIGDLRQLMQTCHVSLGQLADHPRLERTIPHKAFESLALGLPYLTARTGGILELLTENETCYCFTPGDAEDLARTILAIKNNPDQRSRIAQQGYELYQRELHSDHLARELLTRLLPTA